MNLSTLQNAIDSKVLDASKEIDGVALMEAGLIKTMKDGVRLLGKGTLSAKVTLNVAGASEAAQKAVEAAGGKVVLSPKQPTVLVKGQKTSKKQAKA